MNLSRMKKDFKYCFMNFFVGNIPSWRIRRFFYRMLGMKISDSARIGIKTIIDNPAGIVIGDRSIINEFCHIDGRGGVMVGNDVSISVYTKIITATHLANSSSFEYIEDSVKIEDNVWIGCGAILLNGSYIAESAIIGAGSVFKGVAEKNGIYIGNPAFLVSNRNLEKKYELNFKPYFR